MRRHLAGTLLLVLLGLLAGACGDDDEKPAAETPEVPDGETDESGEDEEADEASETDGPSDAPECEGIITFEELSAIVGVEITSCEQGGFFEGRNDTAIAHFNIRVRGSGASPLDDIEGAGWTGQFIEGICATEAPIGDHRYVVQDLRSGEDCKAVTAEIMDAIAARHG